MNDVKENYIELIMSRQNEFEEQGISQESIGVLLGLTRQSISKIYAGDYVQLSAASKEKLKRIQHSSIDDIKAIIDLQNQIEDLKKKYGRLKGSNIEHLTSIFKYIRYWIDNPDLGEDYLKAIRIQIENFHMKLNPYYLFFDIYFDKGKNILLAFDIDYNKNIIKKIDVRNSIERKSIHKNSGINYAEQWNKEYESKNVNFETFIKSILDFSAKLGIAYNIYIDHIDNQLDYIRDKVKSKTAKSMPGIRHYDIAKLFATIDQVIAVEDMVLNYLPDTDKNRILTDAEYRNENISKVLHMISGANYTKEDKILSMMMTSDTDNYLKANAVSQEVVNRRQSKMKQK
jgi:transcriptional regulator with XRE-family HTH domain